MTSIGKLGNNIGHAVAQAMQQAQSATPMGAAVKAIGQGLRELQSLVQEMDKKLGGGSAQAPSQPTPFSPSKVDPQVMANPQQVIINIQINFGGAQPGQASNAPLKSFPLMPESSGAPGSFAAASQALSGRVTGSNKDQFTFDANGPWNAANKDEKVAVAHAMYKNPHVQFDSDSKKFFVTGTDGSRRDVATLDEVVNAGRKAGGFTTSNGAAIAQIAGLLEGRVSSLGGSTGAPAPAGTAQAGQAKPASASNPLQQIMDLLQKLLELLSGKGGAQGASNASEAGGAQAGSSAGEAQGSNGAGSGSGVSESGSAGGKSEILGSESKWGRIDSMMAEAEKLAMSKNPSDQLKAQKMMQQAQQMFQTISKMIQQLGEMFRTAIGNVR